jgi:hypothetical protein
MANGEQSPASFEWYDSDAENKGGHPENDL